VSQRGRLLLWLATRLPQPVAEAPERVFINLICAATGLSVLVSNRPSPLWSHSVATAWSVLMLGGGLAALVGYWQSARRGRTTALERVGYLAILIASVTYSVRVVDVFGWRAVPIALAFLGIAGAKAVRLLISSAARERLLLGGEESGGPR
jgi:tryptophan-rich sensory protein